MVNPIENVEVKPGSTPEVEVQIRNEGNASKSYVTGMSVVQPDGTQVALSPIRTPEIDRQGSATIVYELDTGQTVSNQNTVPVLDESGGYEVITAVYEEVKPDPSKPHDVKLVSELDKVSLPDVLNVEDPEEPGDGLFDDLPVDVEEIAIAGIAGAGALVILNQSNNNVSR